MSCEVVSYELWVMNYELWVMSYELWVMSYELWVMSYELWIMSYELWIMSYELWIMNYELWVMNYELWVMSYELWVMSYELWIMRYECGVKSWSWNILLLEKILHYATLRSEWQRSVFCSRLGIYIIGGIFLNRKDFFSWIAFLSKLSWRNSFAMKRCGEGWRMKDEGCGVRSAGCKYSITKFSEMWWNDSVFEGS